MGYLLPTYFETHFIPMLVCESRSLTVLHVNKMSSKLLGLRPSQLKHKKLDELMVSGKSLSPLKRTLKKPTRLGVFEFKAKAKHDLTYALYVVPIRHSRKDCLLIELHPTQANTQPIESSRSVESYKDLINAIDGIVWEATADTLEFTFVSNQVERILGHTPLQWMTPDFWVNHIHPDDRQYVVQYCKACTCKAQDHKMEYRMLASNGSVVWVSDSVTVISKNGVPVQLKGIITDITQQKKMEAVLQNNQQQLKNLADSLPNSSIYTFMMDAEGQFSLPYISSGIEKITGQKAPELIASNGQSLFDRIHSDDIKKFQKAIANSADQLTEFHQEVRSMSTDGSYKWLSVRSSPYRQLNGSIIWHGVISDITDRVEFIDRLVESENRFIDLAGRMNVGIILHGPNTEILYTNKAALTFMGLTKNQITGKTSFDPMWRVIHEDGSDFPAHTHPVQQVIEKKKPVNDVVMGVYRPAKKDWEWLLVSALPKLDSMKNIMYVLVTFTNITSRKLSEQRVKELDQSLKNIEGAIQSFSLISVVDTKGIILDVNENFEKLSGYTRAELIGKNHSVVNSGYHDKSFWVGMWQTIIKGKNWRGEVKNKAKNGAYYWVDTFIQPVLDERGNVKEFLSIRNNITERMLGQEKTIQYNNVLTFIKLVQNLIISKADTSIVFDQILNFLLEFTQSKFGFIGEVFENADGNPYLKTYSITNIAWDEPSLKLYEKTKAVGMEFHNLKSLFGEVMVTKQVVLSNDPLHDPRRSGLPPGHPPLTAFLGVPILNDTELVGMFGLGNKANGYSAWEYEMLQPLVNTLGTVIDSIRLARKQKVVEDALKLTHYTIEKISDSVYWIDKTGRIVDANLQACERLGYTHKEVESMYVSDIDPHYSHSVWPIHWEELKNKGSLFFQTQHIRKDGVIVDVEINANYIQFGERELNCAIVRDITERLRVEKALVTSNKEKDILMKEIHHRVKNNLQLISSILFLKAREIQDGDVKDFFENTRQKIKSISMIHERLLQTNELDKISSVDYFRKLVMDLEVAVTSPTLKINIDSNFDDVMLNLDMAVYCGIIVNELVTNSVKHAFSNRKEGNISVYFLREENRGSLTVYNDSNSLLDDFKTTNSSSVGLQLVRVLAEQLDAEVHVDCLHGARYTFNFNL